MKRIYLRAAWWQPWLPRPGGLEQRATSHLSRHRRQTNLCDGLAGNRIPDFSHCGYAGGDRRFDAPVRVGAAGQGDH
jgi:hypothetical protein